MDEDIKPGTTTHREWSPYNVLRWVEGELVCVLSRYSFYLTRLSSPKALFYSLFDPVTLLSIVANLTPFSDFNQSPRNMYQCQVRNFFPCLSCVVSSQGDPLTAMPCVRLSCVADGQANNGHAVSQHLLSGRQQDVSHRECPVPHRSHGVLRCI